MDKISVYEIVTQRIIDSLHAGTIPWKKPWNDSGSNRNFSSGHEYQGINILMTHACSDDNLFASYKQIIAMGGKPESKKSIPIVYWNWIETNSKIKNDSENDNNQTEKKPKNKKIPFLRYYLVWSLNNSGLSEDDQKIIREKFKVKGVNPDEKKDTCDNAIRDYLKKYWISIDRSNPCYKPSIDTICMPDKINFNTIEDYYSVYFHELIHSTGNKNRLNRITESINFGNDHYAKEELIAELGSSFLCENFQLSNKHIMDNETAYIQSWIQSLENDPKMIVMASGKAQKAVNYFLNKPVNIE